MRVGSVPGKPYKVLLGYSMFMSFWSTLSGCVCGKGAEAKIIYVPCIKVLKARETEKEKIKIIHNLITQRYPLLAFLFMFF